MNTIEVFQPALKKFLDEISTLNKNGLPAPFFPVCGRTYHENPFKLAFVGWETRNNAGLEEFSKIALEDPKRAINWFFQTIDEEEDFPFREYGNNFGTGFWDFVMKFLSRFYFIPNWKTIKNLSHPELLDGFAWGNTDSIERYEVTAQGKGALYEDWLKLKNASTMFDNAELFLSAFSPKVIVATTWRDTNWLDAKFVDSSKTEVLIKDYLNYHYVPVTSTHAYWTHHPRSMSPDEIEQMVVSILEDINKKNIYQSFPGQEWLNLLETLNVQLQCFASEAGLIFDTLPSWGKETGFYFYHSDWRNCRIGFAFDDVWGKAFFGGVARLNNNRPINNPELISVKFDQKNVPTAHWPYWFYFQDEYKYFDLKLYEDIKNGKFIDKIKAETNRILKVLLELEKEGFRL